MKIAARECRLLIADNDAIFWRSSAVRKATSARLQLTQVLLLALRASCSSQQHFLLAKCVLLFTSEQNFAIFNSIVDASASPRASLSK